MMFFIITSRQEEKPKHLKFLNMGNRRLHVHIRPMHMLAESMLSHSSTIDRVNMKDKNEGKTKTKTKTACNKENNTWLNHEGKSEVSSEW